jgi:hypothetical protein
MAAAGMAPLVPAPAATREGPRGSRAPAVFVGALTAGNKTTIANPPKVSYYEILRYPTIARLAHAVLVLAP